MLPDAPLHAMTPKPWRELGAARELVRVEGGELPVPGAIDGARIGEVLPGLPNTSIRDGIAETLRRFRALHAAGTLDTSDLDR